jgi:hypothetical protein
MVNAQTCSKGLEKPRVRMLKYTIVARAGTLDIVVVLEVTRHTKLCRLQMKRTELCPE